MNLPCPAPEPGREAQGLQGMQVGRCVGGPVVVGEAHGALAGVHELDLDHVVVVHGLRHDVANQVPDQEALAGVQRAARRQEGALSCHTHAQPACVR